MALRELRGAGLRRAARRRPGFVALAAALYLAAGVISAAPAVWHVGTRFLAGGAPGYGEAAPGDHLQTSYRLWLLGHQLEQGRAPWIDPYSFRPESGATANPAVWPFGLPYWPLVAALGPVLAWNVLVLLTFVAAGGLAFAWLRELALARGPALAGGLVFAIAPYRAAQSAGHLLGPISLLLPLSLWAFERGRRGSGWWLVLAGASLASIPLSGQVHLALGAIPFFALYALCRTRAPRPLAYAAAAVAVAIGAGLLIRHTVIAGSLDAGGRSLGEVDFYSAEWLDFVTRHKRHGSESFVFLGWLTPALAAIGLALLVRRRRRALAAVLAVGALVPNLLALGTNFPLYSPLWHALSPFRYPRVPERLMPIACLAIAALVAVAVAELLRVDLERLTRLRLLRLEFLVALVLAVLALDLHTTVFRASAADGGNRAYAAVRERPGRLLELPVFLPDVHFGSAYLYYNMQARRQRPGGYSTTAPLSADQLARRLRPLNCGDWSGGQGRLLRRLGVTAVTLHGGLFTSNPIVPGRTWFAWRALQRHGFRPSASDGAVTAFERGSGPRARPPVAEPSRSDMLFCEGWYPPDGAGRKMSLGHAPLWVYGAGELRLFVRSSPPLRVRLGVDGHTVATPLVSKLEELRVPLGRARWHLVTFDAHLPRVGGRPAGIRVLGYARA